MVHFNAAKFWAARAIDTISILFRSAVIPAYGLRISYKDPLVVLVLYGELDVVLMFNLFVNTSIRNKLVSILRD
jgi:hypothetical protein